MEDNNRGQVTLFIIIAVILVAGVVLFFVFREGIKIGGIPADLEPAHTSFLNCLEENVLAGVNILESQGGYIKLPPFEPGSPYAPTSSQLDFLGSGIPYWYYVSQNGIQKEQVPSLNDMEEQVEDYLEENIANCRFDDFYEGGFEIAEGEPSANVKISDNKIDVKLNMNLALRKADESILIKNHNVVVSSKLGNFYNRAMEIYKDQEKNNFLGVYGEDVLRLYAPVDGIELDCAPKIWVQEEIKTELKNALESNTQAIKIKGDYYELSSKENRYFVHDIGKNIEDNVNFIYSSNWPTKIEIYPNEEILVAEPIGNQPGLGVLGFCYVPYHFVYDLNYPVLVQIYDTNEMFQFPVSVVIDRNKALKGDVGEEVPDAVPELCKYKNQELGVSIYDTDLNSVDAKISFECLGSHCDIGETEDGYLESDFPQCYNGYIIADADGYVRKRYLYSTNTGSDATLILDKLYYLNVDLKIDGKAVSDNAMISFTSEDVSASVVWPEQKTIELAEGQYNISVYVYREFNMNLPGIDKEICNEVPRDGLFGVLGMTKEKCFKIELPDQELQSVVAGGGIGSDYLIKNQLEGGRIEINVNSVPLPKNVEDLGDSYNLIGVSPVYLEFN